VILRSMTTSSDSLSFPRAKRRSVARSAAYRVQPILRTTIGTDRTLRMLLNVERVAWRIAFEAAHLKHGDAFFNASVAATYECLLAWVPSHARILDVGCGNGRLERLLAAHAQSILGIDYDASSIAKAQASGLPTHVHFEVGDARRLEQEAQYDVVTLIHVLEHIDDPQDVLVSLRRLAPTLVVEVPAFDRCVLNPVRRGLGLDFSTDDDHVREYSQELLQEQLESAGWIITDWARGPMSIAARARSASD
jgi:SAM-dependent methyltransferase